MAGELHVALGFDENFWAPAYATMRGVCFHTRRRKDLRFHLCHPRLSDQVLEDLDRITAEFGATLIHYDLETDANYKHFTSFLPQTRYISHVTFARLFFHEIFDKSIERVAYIDCDVMVRAPIEELLAEDLKGRPLGAVREPDTIVAGHGRDGKNMKLLDPADPYFNAGILLIDLKGWRDMDMTGVLYRLEKEGTLLRLGNDQQILNYIFKNNWTYIDRGWNTIAVSPAIEVLDPKIVHYTGLQKPWNLITFLPFRRGYRHLMTNEFFYRYMRQRWVRRWKQRLGLIPIAPKGWSGRLRAKR
jgi:lipopolysaccharide biosynthesis glycosyltransferase